MIDNTPVQVNRLTKYFIAVFSEVLDVGFFGGRL